MVQALVDLYRSTNGTGWADNTNWLDGEPCTNGWAGVYCCPLSHPYLIGAETLDPSQQYCSSRPPSSNTPGRRTRRRLAHDNVSEPVPVSIIPDDGAHFCSTGTWYGNDTDLARCSIVQILLRDNNLAGPLRFLSIDVWPDADTMSANSYPYQYLRNYTFNNLQAMNVESNKVSGRFPTWITTLPSLRVVRFMDNELDVQEEDFPAIVQMCERPGFNCTGLPQRGGSCLAFGENAVLLRPFDESCHDCADPTATLTQWVLVVFLIAVIIVVGYGGAVAWSSHGGERVLKKWASLTPQTPSLKGWVACSCVMSMHYQTIVLLGGARPVWPDSTQAYMQCLSLDYQCFYTIPECTIDLTSVLTRNLDAQMTTNIVMMVILFIPIGVMLVLLIFRAVSKYRLQHEALKPSTAASRKQSTTEMMCTIVTALLFAVGLRVSRQLINWGGASSDTGLVVAGVLLLVLQTLVYLLWAGMAAVAQVARRGVLMHPLLVPKDVLHLAYLAHPFKPKAATWQLLIVLQQLVVFFAAWISHGGHNAILTDGFEYDKEGWFPGARGLGQLIIVIALLVMWLLQIVYEPWESAYQNAASSRLYLCHIIALALGAMWNDGYDNPGFSSLWETWLNFFLIAAPLLAMPYLWLGIHLVSGRIAKMIGEGAIVKAMPFWIRGLRWEELPLPPGSVAIPCVYKGVVSPQRVLDAIKKSAGVTDEDAVAEENDGGDGDDLKVDETTDLEDIALETGDSVRAKEFARAFDRLIEELTEEHIGLRRARGVAPAKAKLAKQRLHAEVSRYTGGLTSILRATKVTKLFESTSVAQQQKKTLMQTTVMDEGEEGMFIDDRLPLQAQSGAAHVLMHEGEGGISVDDNPTEPRFVALEALEDEAQLAPPPPPGLAPPPPLGSEPAENVEADVESTSPIGQQPDGDESLLGSVDTASDIEQVTVEVGQAEVEEQPSFLQNLGRSIRNLFVGEEEGKDLPDPAPLPAPVRAESSAAGSSGAFSRFSSESEINDEDDDEDEELRDRFRSSFSCAPAIGIAPGSFPSEPMSSVAESEVEHVTFDKEKKAQQAAERISRARAVLAAGKFLLAFRQCRHRHEQPPAAEPPPSPPTSPP